jgi:hypothetical protein
MFRGLIVVAIGVVLLLGSISIMIYKEKFALQREWEVLNNHQINNVPDGNNILYKIRGRKHEYLPSEFPIWTHEWIEDDRVGRYNDIYYLPDVDSLTGDSINTP